MTTQKTDTAVPTAEVKPITVTRNNIEIVLHRTETERVKEGATPIAYWALDVEQFKHVPGVRMGADGKPVVKTGPDGKPVVQPNGQPLFEMEDYNPMLVFERLNTVIGHDQLLSKLQAKLNQDSKAAQMGEKGKDTHDMDTKLDMFKAYIEGGFGAERVSGFQAAIDKALKKQQAAMVETGKAMATLVAEMSNPQTTPERRVAIVAEMTALTAKMTA